LWPFGDSLPAGVSATLLDTLLADRTTKRTLRLVNRSARAFIDARVRRVEVYCDPESASWLPQLKAAVAAFPSLSDLAVDAFSPEALTELAPTLASLSSTLTSLEFNGLRSFVSVECSQFCAALSALTKLQRLVLPMSDDLEGTIPAGAVEAMQRLHDLRVLKLGGKPNVADKPKLAYSIALQHTLAVPGAWAQLQVRFGWVRFGWLVGWLGGWVGGPSAGSRPVGDCSPAPLSPH